MKLKLLFLFLILVCSANAQVPIDTLAWPIDKAFMRLDWHLHSDNSGDSLTYDVIENNNLLGNTGDTTFVVMRPDSGLYRYWIVAIDISNNRGAALPSDFIYVSWQDTIPPQPPDNIKVSIMFLDTRLGAVGFDGSFEHESDIENYVLSYTKDDTSQFESIIIGRDKEFTISLREPYWLSIGIVGVADSVRTRWMRTVEQ